MDGKKGPPPVAKRSRLVRNFGGKVVYQALTQVCFRIQRTKRYDSLTRMIVQSKMAALWRTPTRLSGRPSPTTASLRS